MYYSPEGLLGLVIQLLILAAFILPGYLIVNYYFTKVKKQDTSLPGNYEKTIWGGFLVTIVLVLLFSFLKGD
jgi:hypothetical protein